MAQDQPAHIPFGKMAEVTQHWDTSRHPAFKKPKSKPKDVTALEKQPALANDQALWVITEKIHGSNCSFVVFPDRTVRCAKREEFLDDADDADNATFFGYRKVKEKYKAAALAVYDKMKQGFDNRRCADGPSGGRGAMSTTDAVEAQVLKRVTIYGELFGGTFPSLKSPEDVPKGGVQDGLFYSPDLHFAAFDLAVTTGPPSTTTASSSPSSTASAPKQKTGENDDDYDDDDDSKKCEPLNNNSNNSTTHQNHHTEFVNFIPALSILSSCGFLTVQPLAVGSFEDCCNFNINFVSKIPNKLGVPRDAQKLVADMNFAEGIVCRTNVTQFVSCSGVNKNKMERCMFKRKIHKFAAVCQSRAQQVARETEMGGGGGVNEAEEVEAQLLAFVKNFVDANIVNSAVSKTGKPTGSSSKAAKIKARVGELVRADVDEAIAETFYPTTLVVPTTLSNKKPPSGGAGGGKAAAAAASSSSSPAKVAEVERLSCEQLIEKCDERISAVIAQRIGEILN